VLTNEFENAAEYGAFVDELYRDAETDSFLARIGAEDSPLIIESRSLATEIALERRGTRTHGSVIEAYLSRLVPGRFEACRDLAVRAFDFLERHDATNCRWLQPNAAGTPNEAMLVSWEFENMQAWGTATDASWTHPASQPILEVVMGRTVWCRRSRAASTATRTYRRATQRVDRAEVDPPRPRGYEPPASDSAVEATVTPPGVRPTTSTH
jgi:hypothetical protein